MMYGSGFRVQGLGAHDLCEYAGHEHHDEGDAGDEGNGMLDEDSMKATLP